MELISNLLYPFEDLEFVCEEHGIPCIGLCSNYSCKERIKFLCKKCIKSGETCITKEKHELLTLTEMLYKFFKEENKSLEVKEIQTLNQIIKEYDKSELNKISTQFKSMNNLNNIINCENLKNIFLEMMNYFIDTYKEKNKENLEILKEISNNNKDENDIKLLLDIKIPEIDKTSLEFNQKMIDFLNNIDKHSSTKNFINSVKLLNNSDKLNEASNQMKKKIYAYHTTNINDEKKSILEKKIDLILDDLEKKFDLKMQQIEKEIILPKDTESIYTPCKLIPKFVKDPTKLIYKEDICNTAHKKYSINKVFCVFKSLQGESLVVWGTPQYSIEFYDLDKEKIIQTISNAHNQIIFSCRHSSDFKNNIDYIITSSYDKTIKIWDLRTFQQILHINSWGNDNYIYSVHIFCDQKEGCNYIITSSQNDNMSLFDFKGSHLGTFGSLENTYFIDTYYDSKEDIYYVINANNSDIKSYVFKTKDLYQKYEGFPKAWHMSAIVNEVKDNQILIESDKNGNIRMWDFHKGNLIKTISPSSPLSLRGICLWNDNYLLAAGSDYQVKLIDLEQGKFIKSFEGHTNIVCSIEKILHPKYGECLLSQGLDGKIKIWIPN